MVYKLFSDHESIKNLKAVHQHLNPSNTTAQHDHTALDAWFSILYTAYTRAQHTLLICEDIQSRFNGLMLQLQHSIQHHQAESQPQSTSLPTTNWEDEITKQQTAGNDDIAKQIKTLAARKKCKQKKVQPTALQTKAAEVLSRFHEKFFISNWVKQPDFIAVLFDTSISLNDETPQTLFEHIIQEKDRTKRFAVAMGINSLQFVTHDFIEHAINYPDLPNVISEQLFNNIIQYQTKMISTPSIARWIFLTICITPGDVMHFIEVLTDMDLANSSIAMAQILTEIQPRFNTTFLWMLAGFPEGRVSLNILIEKHDSIINSIPHEAWAFTNTEQTGAHRNTSPLYWLTGCSEGLVILDKLIDKYPHIIKKIPAKAWTVALSAQAGKSENISPLYWLTACSQGLSILTKLIEKHPDVINSIPATAWSLARTKQAGFEENISPLYCLTIFREGRVILTKLIKKHLDIISQIPPKAWCLTLPAGHFKHTSPIYSLMTCVDGQKILTYLKGHTHILQSIPDQDWDLLLKNALHDTERYNVQWLRTTTVNRAPVTPASNIRFFDNQSSCQEDGMHQDVHQRNGELLNERFQSK